MLDPTIRKITISRNVLFNEINTWDWNSTSKVTHKASPLLLDLEGE